MGDKAVFICFTNYILFQRDSSSRGYCLCFCDFMWPTNWPCHLADQLIVCGKRGRVGMTSLKERKERSLLVKIFLKWYKKPNLKKENDFNSFSVIISRNQESNWLFIFYDSAIELHCIFSLNGTETISLLGLQVFLQKEGPQLFLSHLQHLFLDPITNNLLWKCNHFKIQENSWVSWFVAPKSMKYRCCRCMNKRAKKVSCLHLSLITEVALFTDCFQLCCLHQGGEYSIMYWGQVVWCVINFVDLHWGFYWSVILAVCAFSNLEIAACLPVSC